MKALRPLIFLVVWALPAAAGDVSAHAVISKRLTRKVLSPIVYDLRGTPPPAQSGDNPTESELDRTVLWIEGPSLKPPAPVTAVIEQRNSHFEPDLVVVPVGSTVQFPNEDPIFHNVFSLSKAHRFDLGFYPQGHSRSVKFDHAGVVQVYCHIHANMYAAIVVTSSPWYGKPLADGSFTWKNVPAGHYRLIAWHKVAGLHRVDLNVPADGHVDATIRIPIDVESRH